MLQISLHMEVDPNAHTKAGELATLLNIPGPVLSKVLHRLAEQGLLHSLKGPTGGVRLARPASSIQILDIVHALDGEDALSRCVMGFETCSADVPCPMHAIWKQIRGQLVRSLADASLQDWSQDQHTHTLSLITHAQSGAGI